MMKKATTPKRRTPLKRKASSMQRMEYRRSEPGRDILGTITGRIAPTSTTLAKAHGPFQGVKYVTLLYENGLTALANNASYFSANIVCNGPYDVDNNLGNYFGNKQPLYFDTLLSASGPYKQYKVLSWKTTYTLINQTAVPINVYVLPPISAGSEIDSVAEAENFPGVVKRYLTAKDGARNITTITVTGHVDDVYPGNMDGLVGTYAANPANPIIGGILVASADGTTTATVYCAIVHEMYTELQVVDALVS